MKIVSRIFFTFLVFLLGVSSALAINGPPAPRQQRSGTPPPDGPIDDGIYILLVVAVLFGLYVVYSKNKKTETSV